MKALNPDHPVARSGGLEAFFDSIAAAPLRVLMLDFDGTLAPFTVDRLQTTLYSGVHERLVRLADMPGHRLIIVSGRPIADLRSLLAMDPHPECWGSHGWERLAPHATTAELHPPNSSHAEALSRARTAALAAGWNEHLETKPTSVALHWRGLNAPERSALKDAAEAMWRPLASETGVELHAFDGGLELRIPGRNKGSVVEAVLDEIPATAAVAYLGDDLTDEDAFRALGNRGVRVLVRAELRPTLADLWIVPPDELIEFLDRWIDASA